LNADAIAVNQDPLGIGGARVYKSEGGAEVWSKPLINNSWAVILYNSQLLPVVDPLVCGYPFTVTSTFLTCIPSQEITVYFNSTYLPGWPDSESSSAQVRDLWEHNTFGPVKESYSSVVVPHDVRF